MAKIQTNNLTNKYQQPKKSTLRIKSIAIILAICMFICVGGALTACNKNMLIVDDISTLLKDYKSSTTTFLNSEVLKVAVSKTANEFSQDKVLSADYDLGDGTQQTLKSVKVMFIYIDGENRIYQINKVDFQKDIALAKVAEYDKNKTELATAVGNATITEEFTFTYDAVQNAQYKDLAKAMYENIVKSDETAVHLMIKLNEVKDYNMNGMVLPCGFYTLTSQTENTTKQYEIIMLDGKMEQMIPATQNSNCYKFTQTKDIATFVTYLQGYEYKEEDIVVPPLVDNLGELIDNYQTQLSDFLAAHTQKAIENVVGSYNKDNVKSVRWDIGNDDVTYLTEIDIEFTIADPSVEGKETFYRATVSYEEFVDLQTIAVCNTAVIAEIVENANYQSATKTFEYNTKEQYFKQDIVDALVQAIERTVTEQTQVMVDFGESKRGYTTYKVVLSDKQGYGEYTLTAKDGATTQQTIDNILLAGVSNKEHKNTSNTFDEKAYVKPEYQVNDIETALTYFSEKIKENMDKLYVQIKNTSITQYSDISSYNWDFGAVENGEIKTLKLYIKYINTRTLSYYFAVYEVNLPNSITVNNLLNEQAMSEIVLKRTDVKNVYEYSYNPDEQGDKDVFINTVAQTLLTDGFDYNADGTLKLYTEHYAGVTENYYKISISNSTGVRYFEIQVSNTLSTDEELAEAIRNGEYEELSQNAIDFSKNQINVNLSNAN